MGGPRKSGGATVSGGGSVVTFDDGSTLCNEPDPAHPGRRRVTPGPCNDDSDPARAEAERRAREAAAALTGGSDPRGEGTRAAGRRHGARPPHR